MWLVLPFSACAAASAASTSLSDSACQALASCATWRGKSMPPRFWLRAWKRATWMRRLSGVTCDPSTVARGVALWMGSLRATRASRSASPAADAESWTRGTCGPTSGASSARSNRDGSLPRTSPATWTLGSPRSWPTLPPSGSMRRGVCSPLPAVEPRTCADAYIGLVPTPTTDHGLGGGSHARAKAQRMGLIPTPTAIDSTGGRTNRSPSPGASVRPTLAKWVRIPTPTSMDSVGARNRTSGRSNPESKHHDGMTLNDFVRLYPTPTARDYRSGKASEATHARNSRPLSEAVGGTLNPQWVEWLMGFPTGWTDCAPSATRLCRQSPRGRSES